MKPQTAPPEQDKDAAAATSESDALTRALDAAEALASRLESPPQAKSRQGSTASRSTGSGQRLARRVTRSAVAARRRGAPEEESPSPPPDVPVTFVVRKHVPYGSRIAVVGSSPALGSWRLDRAVPMAWSTGDVWRSPPVMLSVNSAHAYKYVVLSPNVATWQPGPNQSMVVDRQDMPGAEVTDSWSGAPGEASVASGPRRERQPADVRLDESMRRLHSSLEMAHKLAADAYAELVCTQAVVEALREEVREHQAALQTAKHQAQQEREQRAALAQQLASFKAAVQGVRQQLASRLQEHNPGGRSEDQAR